MLRFVKEVIVNISSPELGVPLVLLTNCKRVLINQWLRIFSVWLLAYN